MSYSLKVNKALGPMSSLLPIIDRNICYFIMVTFLFTYFGIGNHIAALGELEFMAILPSQPPPTTAKCWDEVNHSTWLWLSFLVCQFSH